MQEARPRAFSTSHGGDLSGFNHEFQSDPGFSRTSTYTARSRIVDKKVKSSRSSWGVAAAIAGALRKCRDGDAVVAMDTRMRRSSAAVAAVEKVMALAAECAAPDRAARPAMRRCAEVLWSVRRDFQHEQQRAAAAAAGAGARRRDGSTYGPSVTSLRE